MRVLLAGMILVVAGCRRPPPVVDFPDGGPEADAPIVVPGADTDGDGLCDSTEASLGIDPGRPDTDGDGFSDMIEYSTGYDASRAVSPDPAVVVYLTEAPGARVDSSVRMTASGEGQSFVGEFHDFLGSLRHPDLSASSYFLGAAAVGALPSDAIISVDGQRFIGLRDRALLVTTLSFENVSVGEGCVRGFAFQYRLIDDTDGRIAASSYGLLVVTPPGVTATGETWCRLTAPGSCF